MTTEGFFRGFFQWRCLVELTDTRGEINHLTACDLIHSFVQPWCVLGSPQLSFKHLTTVPHCLSIERHTYTHPFCSCRRGFKNARGLLFFIPLLGKISRLHAYLKLKASQCVIGRAGTQGQIHPRGNLFEHWVKTPREGSYVHLQAMEAWCGKAQKHGKRISRL